MVMKIVFVSFVTFVVNYFCFIAMKRTRFNHKGHKGRTETSFILIGIHYENSPQILCNA